MENQKNTYCSQQQKCTLVDMLSREEYKILTSGKFSSNFSFKNSEKKWKEIAAVLNFIPGSRKDWKQWRKSWQDIRSKTKKRRVEQVKYSSSTGGGPSYSDQLTDTDEKVLSMTSPVEVLGNQDVEETEINFEFKNESIPSFNIEHDINMSMEIYDEHTSTQPTSIDVQKDHIYYKKSSEIPANNKENKIKKKRTVAGQRFREIITACKTLAELAKEKLDYKKQYYEKKLCLLGRQVSTIENLAEVLKKKPELSKYTEIVHNQ